MARGGSTLVGALLLVVAVTGAAAGGHAIDLSTRLDAAIDDAVDRSLRDLTVGWLEVVDARAHVQDGTAHQIELVVRLDGAATGLDTENLVLTTTGPTDASLDAVEALRDADGSLEDGHLDRSDLARLTVDLGQPLTGDETLTLTLHETGKTPLTIEVTTPPSLSEPYTALETTVTW